MATNSKPVKPADVKIPEELVKHGTYVLQCFALMLSGDIFNLPESEVKSAQETVKGFADQLSATGREVFDKQLQTLKSAGKFDSVEYFRKPRESKAKEKNMDLSSVFGIKAD